MMCEPGPGWGRRPGRAYIASKAGYGTRHRFVSDARRRGSQSLACMQALNAMMLQTRLRPAHASCSDVGWRGTLRHIPPAITQSSMLHSGSQQIGACPPSLRPACASSCCLPARPGGRKTKLRQRCLSQRLAVAICCRDAQRRGEPVTPLWVNFRHHTPAGTLHRLQRRHSRPLNHPYCYCSTPPQSPCRLQPPL